MHARSACEGAQPPCPAGGAPREAWGAPLLEVPPASASFLLDTPGITRQVRENVGEKVESGPRPLSPGRLAWLNELERLTERHREARAKGHEAKARAVEAKARDELRRREVAASKGDCDEWDAQAFIDETEAERDARDAGRWYRWRARGQRERFETARACGDGSRVLEVLCTGCGSMHKRVMSCGHGRLCFPCRAKKIRARRGRIARAREVALERAWDAGRLLKKRRGGAHSEKLLVLTLPHLDEHDVRARIELAFAALPFFIKSLNAHLRERNEPVDWLRTFEWTLGGDGRGHPHFNFWMLGPFIEHAFLVEWWREALVRAGFPESELATLVVHFNRDPSGERLVSELIKYVIKDIIADGEQVPAETYAEVYESLEGRRIEQGSFRFVGLGEQDVRCEECDAAESFLARVDAGPWRGSREAHLAYVARGPPLVSPPRRVPSVKRQQLQGDPQVRDAFIAKLRANLRPLTQPDTLKAWLRSRPHVAWCHCPQCGGKRAVAG